MRRSTNHILAGVAASLAMLASTHAQVPMDDHFDATMNPQWVILRGSPYLQNGWLVLTRTDFGNPRDTAMVFQDGDTTIRDFVLHLRVDPVVSGYDNWKRAGVSFRTTNAWSPGQTGYYLSFVFDPAATPYATLARGLNGVGTELARITPYTPTLPMDVVIRAIEHSIQIYINGSLAFNINDPAGPLAGGIGMWNVWESLGRYDDITLTLLPPACPGDADGNGTVNFSDITQVLASFGTMCP
jgi:hypothetical protein